IATVLAIWDPVSGESLPSKLAVYTVVARVPSALTNSAVTFSPWPAGSTFTVRLWGIGPGLYFDFATLSFHVPILGSLAWADRLAIPAPRINPSARTIPSVDADQGARIVSSQRFQK